MTAQKLRFLTVSAHPHDFTWYSATLGIHIERGDEATVCVVTHGGSTHREDWMEELRKPESERDVSIVNASAENYIKQKEQELRNAAAIFGISDIRMLDFPDKPFLISEHPEVIDRIAELIVEVRPHVMITESPFTDSGRPMRYRSDHTEVGIAAAEAKLRAELPRPGSTWRPHQVAMTFWPGSSFDLSQLDLVVDLSDEWFEKRVQAEACFESQGHDQEWARARMALDLGPMGNHARTAYGEGYVREKLELYDHLPVSEVMIKQTEVGDTQNVRRMFRVHGAAAS
jgi:LmbE family N-acetylglucosaminyl deacetylase